jgi:hypothetical protein
MAILARSDRFRPVLRRALLAAALLTASGCLVLEQLGLYGGDSGFPHVTHVRGEEMECIDCHMDYEDGEEPGMPTLDDCLLCHEDESDDMPPVAVEEFFADEEGVQLANARVTTLSDEIIFSHQDHVSDEEGCLDCHGELAESEGIRSWMAVDMDGCTGCHEEQQVPNECSTCHTVIRQDLSPPSHDGLWDANHGLSVRNRSMHTADRCSMCHEEDSCTTCHEETPPANHGHHWRRRGHGLTAAMDRQNCAACHTQDYCDRCHQEVVPLTHRGSWGGSRNTHCLDCHLGGGSEPSCSLCHDGTPSHDMAPPLPPGHDPGSDCRSCHFLIDHVDNGDRCTICHY